MRPNRRLRLSVKATLASVAAAALIAVGLVPAAAVAPLGNSTFLAQTQTQNLSGINGAAPGATYLAQSVTLNGTTYFIGNGPTTGAELYSTDGTSSNTAIVKDIYPNATGYTDNLTLSNGLLFMSSQSNDGKGFEPWVHNPTTGQTFLLKDIAAGGSHGLPNPSSGDYWKPKFTQGPNGLTYFAADDLSTSTTPTGGSVYNDRELWVTDGVAGGAGTYKVKNINTYAYYYSPGSAWYALNSNFQNFTACNGLMFFSANDNYDNTELWVTDGTEANTRMVKDINTNTTILPYRLYSSILNSDLAANSSTSLGSNPKNLTCVGSTLFFSANDGGGTYQLWKSDGTSSNTVKVRGTADGSAPSEPQNMFSYNGKLLFSALAASYGPSSANYGYELWTSDGTSTGTVLLKDINPTSLNSSPSNFVLFGGQAFFVATDSRGAELWKTDGTTVGTLFVKDIDTTASGASGNPANFYVWNSKLYFTASDGISGRELYVSSGTGATTNRVKDIFPGISDILDTSNFTSNIPYFSATSTALIFVANSPIYGQELWKTDGTESGTALLKDLNSLPGNANSHDAIAFNGKIYFSAASAYFGQELWSTDLTGGNTQMVLDIFPGASSGMDATASYFTIYNGRLYFPARNPTTGWELWSTDGTAQGTKVAADVYPGYGPTSGSQMPANLKVCNGKLFYGQQGSLYTLYAFDGTSSTVMFNNQLFVGNTACLNNELYFTATNYASRTYDVELWKSGGTLATTALFFDAYPETCGSQGCSGNPSNLTVFGNKLYFTANNASIGTELWWTDGTNTSYIDIRSGTSSSSPAYLRVYKNELYLKAHNGTNGNDLMSFDGTTLTPRDLVAGTGGLSMDSGVVIAGDLLWYRGYESTSGNELHSSNGTSADSGIFEDLSPGSAGTTITGLTAVGGILIYNTSDSVMGSQPRFVVVSAISVVTFNGNGHTSGSAPNDIAVMSISATIPGNTGSLAKTNYNFKGWNTNPLGTGTTYLPGSTITPIVDTPLYAMWASNATYTITYNANNATSGVVPPALTGVNSLINLDTNSGALARTGYSFGGWNTQANGLGTNYLGGDRYTPTADVTLYAKWNQLTPYTLTFDKNTATGTAPSAINTYATATVALPGVGSMIAPTGKTFAGWNTNSAGTGSAYAAAETLSPQSNMTLYAQWTALPPSTLTYNSNGATSGNVPAAVTATSTYVVIDSNSGNLFKSGYVFSGWNTQSDGFGTTFQGTDNYLLSADITLYAKWTVANYSVTFSGNGNTGGTVPSTITGVSISTTLPVNSGNLIRAGYTFAGWNTLSSGLGTSYLVGDTYSPISSTTLYAKWTALPTYSITYNDNGSTGGGAPVTQTGIYSSTTLDNNSGVLVKTGYYFAGWNTLADGTGTTYLAGASYTPTANVTLYALWSAVVTYTVTYFGNTNTSGTAPLPQTGITSTVSASGNTGTLAKLGYRFDGWNTAANGTGTPYVAGDTIAPSSDVSLYAQWVSVPTYTITYDGNGKTSGSVPNSLTSSDTTVTLAQNTGVLNKTNSTFVGWNTAADGSGVHYDVGAAFTLSANVRLYAEWLGNIYTLTYKENFATSGTVPGSTSGRGTLTTALNSGSLAKAGYSFSGWNTAADGSGTTVSAGSTFTPSADTNLYAKWTALPTYSVTFNSNGADSGTVPSTITGVYASTTIPDNTGSLVKSAAVFGGWNTQANGGGTTYTAGTSYTPTANVTLYAVWYLNYSLTYDANGADSGSTPANQTGLAGPTTVAGNTGTLVRNGYNFAGWNTAANGSGNNYSGGSSLTSNSNVTLYAKWTLIPTYTITYNGNGYTSGSVPTATTSANSQVVSGAGSLAKSNHIFAGWNTAANGSGAGYLASSTYSVSANVTLFAQWTAVFDLTYDGNSSDGGTIPSAVTSVASSAVAAVGTLTKTGYAFAGWNTNAGGTGTSHASGSTITLTANTTLYAQWTLNVYNLSYSGNGSDAGNAPATATGVATSVASSQGSLTKSNSSFLGWNTAANGSGTSYSQGATVTLSSNLTLYAQWSANTYTVTYLSNGATSGLAPAATSSSTGSATLAGNTGSLKREQYEFAGWNTQADGNGANYAAGASISLTSNVTLYAKWKSSTPPPRFSVSSLSKQKFATSGGKLEINGTYMTLVEYVSVDGQSLQIAYSSDSKIIVLITTLKAGKYDLVLEGTSSKYTYQSAIEIFAPATKVIANVPTKNGKVSADVINLILLEAKRNKNFTDVQLSFSEANTSIAKVGQVSIKDNLQLLLLARQIVSLVDHQIGVSVQIRANTSQIVLTFSVK